MRTTTASSAGRLLRPVGRQVAGLALAVLLAAACTSGGSTSRSTTSSSTSSSTSTTSRSATSGPTATSGGAGTTTVALYFVRGNYLGVAHRAVPVTSPVGSSALAALLTGPSGTDGPAGLSTAVPAGSGLLSLAVDSGTATADFTTAFATPGTPGEELARVAQVVYTLTQFPAVQRVVFEIAGSPPATFASGAVKLTGPLGRLDVLGALPAILLENPAPGDTVQGDLHLTGLAAVYEAQFRVQLVEGVGTVLVDQPVQASAGSGTWGTFDVTFPFTAAVGSGTVKVYDLSARDGTRQDEVDVPVRLGS